MQTFTIVGHISRQGQASHLSWFRALFSHNLHFRKLGYAIPKWVQGAWYLVLERTSKRCPSNQIFCSTLQVLGTHSKNLQYFRSRVANWTATSNCGYCIISWERQSWPFDLAYISGLHDCCRLRRPAAIRFVALDCTFEVVVAYLHPWQAMQAFPNTYLVEGAFQLAYQVVEAFQQAYQVMQAFRQAYQVEEALHPTWQVTVAYLLAWKAVMDP